MRIFLFLFASPAFAGFISHCDMFANLSPLAARADVKSAVELREAAVRVVKTNESLPSLSDGVYVFLIYRRKDGTTYGVYENRFPPGYPQTPGGPELLTHRTLTSSNPEKADGDEIVAGGEFRIRRGKVWQVNNKTDTYRGDGDRLKLATAWWKGHGLPVEEKTYLGDWSRSTQLTAEHAPEILQVRLRKVFRESPELAAVQKEVEETMEDLYRLYPSEKFPGVFQPECLAFGHPTISAIAPKGLAANDGVIWWYNEVFAYYEGARYADIDGAQFVVARFGPGVKYLQALEKSAEVPFPPEGLDAAKKYSKGFRALVDKLKEQKKSS